MTLAAAGLRTGIAALNSVGAGLAAVGIKPPRLDVESLRRAAIRRAGCEDFGSWAIEEPMERLVRAYHDEAQLTTLGRITVHETLVSQLENLLHLEHDRARRPQIAEQSIRSPVFITGLPRTGTTLLHGLMTEDPENRVPLTWEVMYPASPGALDVTALRNKTNARLAWVSRLAPGFERIHPLEADLPQECIAITALAFMSIQFHTTHDVPSYEDWLEAGSQRLGYAFHHRLLQHLQSRRAGTRWVLKAPGHLFALAELLEQYPDARVIQTHRDPLRVVASMASLATVLKRAFSNAADAHRIGKDWADRWAMALERFLRVRDKSPAAQFMDISYEELVTEPIGTVESVYSFLGSSLCDEARSRMQAFIDRNPQNKHGRHRYSLSEYGLDAHGEAARFREYCERFGIPMRVSEAR
jgi:hypothetical protein